MCCRGDELVAGVVIVGVGNLLGGDDGVGVRAVQALLEGDALPPGIRAIDAGALGLDILNLIEPDECVVVLDAVRLGRAPGTIHRVSLAEIAASPVPEISTHELGLGHVLFVARTLGRPLEGTLVGVEPERIGSFLNELSPGVEAALPALAQAAVREARRLLSGA
jgi:hydrogenase maturation protease